MYCRSDFEDPLLEFDASLHRYTWGGLELTSVTTVVHNLCRPFDADYHSAVSASRTGRTQAEVLAEWAAKASEAARVGTAVHAEAERIALQLCDSGFFSVGHIVDHKVGGYCRGAWSWFRRHLDLSYGWVIPEARVCHPEWGISGTVDLLCALDGAPAIVDFKTSAAIDLGGFGTMLDPVADLPDSEFWHYSLQLSLYQAILASRYDYRAERLAIVWLGPGGTMQQLEVPSLSDRIGAVIESHLEKSRLVA